MIKYEIREVSINPNDLVIRFYNNCSHRNFYVDKSTYQLTLIGWVHTLEDIYRKLGIDYMGKRLV